MADEHYDELGYLYNGPSRPRDEIVRGNWIDITQSRGFSNYPGIYICIPGSNTAYGNRFGGFPDVAAAEKFNIENLQGIGHITTSKLQ